MRMNGLRPALIATVVMALVSAFADAFWAAALPEHRAIYGLVHGALLLGVMGYLVGRVGGSGRAPIGALFGLLIGLLAAALFYVLYPVIGVTAMLIAWMTLWSAFAWLSNTLDRNSETMSRTLTRAVVAALGSGIGFWAISGIWLGPHDPGPLYWRNVVAWGIAFLPGFLALRLGRGSNPTD